MLFLFLLFGWLFACLVFFFSFWEQGVVEFFMGEGGDKHLS